MGRTMYHEAAATPRRVLLSSPCRELLRSAQGGGKRGRMRSRDLWLLAALLLAACSDDTIGANGGSGSCAKFTACGGDVVGRWTVEDVCFENPGVLFPNSGDQPDCSDALDDFKAHASGSYTYNADLSYTSEVTINYDLDVKLTSKCINAIAGSTVAIDSAFCGMLEAQYKGQTSQFTAATCKLDAGGCDCKLKASDSNSTSSGTYHINGNQLVDETGNANDPFCVEGDALTISHSAGGLTGTISLKRKG